MQVHLKPSTCPVESRLRLSCINGAVVAEHSISTEAQNGSIKVQIGIKSRNSTKEIFGT